MMKIEPSTLPLVLSDRSRADLEHVRRFVEKYARFDDVVVHGPEDAAILTFAFLRFAEVVRLIEVHGSDEEKTSLAREFFDTDGEEN